MVNQPLAAGIRATYSPCVQIPETHQSELLKRGYTIVPGFLSAKELATANREMLGYFPSAEELAATPQRYGSIFEDPEHLQIEFPFASDGLNDISTHPDLIDFVQRLLGTKEILYPKPPSGRSTPAPAISIKACIWIIKAIRSSRRGMMATTGRST